MLFDIASDIRGSRHINIGAGYIDNKTISNNTVLVTICERWDSLGAGGTEVAAK